MAPRHLPDVELFATPEALESLNGGIDRVAVTYLREDPFVVWLKAGPAGWWSIAGDWWSASDAYDVRTLAIGRPGPSGLILDGQPMQPPDSVEAWSSPRGGLSVLRWLQVSQSAPHLTTFGSNAETVDIFPPGEIPDNAVAIQSVAGGLLMEGPNDRFLIYPGAGSLDLIVMRDQDAIRDLLALCEVIPANAYAKRLRFKTS